MKQTAAPTLLIADDDPLAGTRRRREDRPEPAIEIKLRDHDQRRQKA